VGDVANIVLEERCGILWRDFQELGEAVDQLLGDAASSSEMARRARQVAEGRLSWRTLVRRFVDVYQRLPRAG
jgi:glycosyltransferase involved in cell wall biosynthesis